MARGIYNTKAGQTPTQRVTSPEAGLTWCFDVDTNSLQRWDGSAWEIISTSREVVNVKDYGAVGDGSTDDAAAIQLAFDAAFGTIASPNGTANAELNKEVYFPPGIYKVSTPILMKYTKGGRVMGAGRFVTQIFNSNGEVFLTDGIGYCHFEGMEWENKGTAVPVLSLDWDGAAGGPGLQACTFVDLHIAGGTIGVDIADGGFMGSEMVFLSCHFRTCNVAAIKVSSSNALQQSMYGGNIQNCTNFGIWVEQGSFPIISGVGFQNGATSNVWDINISGGNQDSCVVTACRTESKNFCLASGSNSVSTTVIGCTSLSSTLGTFVRSTSNNVSITGCEVKNAVISSESDFTSIQDCSFDNDVWLAQPGNLTFGNKNIHISNIRHDLGTGDKHVRGRQLRVNLQSASPEFAIFNTETSECGWLTNTATTASTTQTQGNGDLGLHGAKTNPQIFNVQTVANDDDTVTLPALGVHGTDVESGVFPVTIMNNGANRLQIFPASGEDLGEGTNNPVTLRADGIAKFIGHYQVDGGTAYTRLWKQLVGRDLDGSATWDPGNIADGNEEAQDITVTGAALGDFVLVSFSLDVTDLVLTGCVTAANTVTASLSNNTGGAIDLSSGTVRARVMRL